MPFPALFAASRARSNEQAWRSGFDRTLRSLYGVAKLAHHATGVFGGTGQPVNSAERRPVYQAFSCSAFPLRRAARSRRGDHLAGIHQEDFSGRPVENNGDIRHKVFNVLKGHDGYQPAVAARSSRQSPDRPKINRHPHS